MRLSELGEFGLIEKIRRSFSVKSPRAPLSIGDDAAALAVSPSSMLLATTDMLVEGVHFDLSFTDFFSLGWKSAAVNLSDIAAMGGIPRFCLTALAIPQGIGSEQIADFYKGFGAVLREHAVLLVGGDTCSSGKGFIITVTALGETEKALLLRRSGARPGDRIFVTGTLGDSAAGLELLRNAEWGMRNKKSEIRNPKSAIGRLAERHLRPVPRVAEGLKIARSGCATSMIDVSDGLTLDLSHLCDESGAGAQIFSGKIPLSNALRGSAGALTGPVLDYALAGGEDYELLFTAPPRKLKCLRGLKIQATEIGIVTKARGIALVGADGKKKPLTPQGYDHFRRR
ncbi:MAG: thiamine-phosphate kinase [Nitrospirota bacterium]|mgnify:CR=1 FL=1